MKKCKNFDKMIKNEDFWWKYFKPNIYIEQNGDKEDIIEIYVVAEITIKNQKHALKASIARGYYDSDFQKWVKPEFDEIDIFNTAREFVFPMIRRSLLAEHEPERYKDEFDWLKGL